ncbi:MAG: Uma2 family endonuclease [Saprospiraceae bacterium]|nr:Uma2 family endonuclease [Saprospiraceae bacterium]
MAVQIEKQLFTIADYYKMADSGILQPEDRLELINGEIIKKSPIKSRHASMVDLLNEMLVVALHKKALIRVQNPVRLDNYSEPEPDLAIVKKRLDRYSLRHPRPADILLIIEVAESSIYKDREVKAPLYAKAGIAEYWIVNIPDEQIEVYTQLSGEVYGQKEIVKGEGKAVCTGIFFELAMEDIF